MEKINKLESILLINSFFASGFFCRLLIIYTNSLDPDQDRQNVGPDLDPNSFTLRQRIFWKS